MPYNKQYEQFCIIGGSGRIGNRVISMLMEEKDVPELSILLTKHTVNDKDNPISDTSQDGCRGILNGKIDRYNRNKEKSEQRVFIPTNVPVYFDINSAYDNGSRIFIFCGKDSDEVRYFIEELYKHKKDELNPNPVIFLSIADRLANDGTDLNAAYKAHEFISRGIMYHHGDMITKAGKEIKAIVEELKSQYSINQLTFNVYDYSSSSSYLKAFNTTRKLCRLLERAATSLVGTKEGMPVNSPLKIDDSLTVLIARPNENSELPSELNWLADPDKERPSIGLDIMMNGISILQEKKPLLFCFEKPNMLGLVTDMAEHTIKKAKKYTAALLQIP